MIRLTLENDKSIIVAPHAILIVESFTAAETSDNRASGAWLTLGGATKSAILQDQYESITRKLGSDRIQLSAKDGKKFSLSPHLIDHAIEMENGMTLVHTSLNSGNGPVALEVHDSAKAIMAAIAPEPELETIEVEDAE